MSGGHIITTVAKQKYLGMVEYHISVLKGGHAHTQAQYMHTHTYICTHAHTHRHNICTHIRTRTHTYTHTHTHTHMLPSINTHMYICNYVACKYIISHKTNSITMYINQIHCYYNNCSYEDSVYKSIRLQGESVVGV